MNITKEGESTPRELAALNLKDTVASRQAVNKKILRKLEQFILDNPHIRFCQALQNLNINTTEMVDIQGHGKQYIVKDTFYEEPNITYSRIKYDEGEVTRRKY